MSNYTKTTDFEAKDSLPTGDSGKIIRGAEFETEFDAISTAIATKADTAGPTFTGTLTFETISDGTIGVTAFVDEDDMSSNSATLVPTQQSVKAYVDSQVTAQDLDFQADSGGALSIDLDSETMTFTGGTGIDTSGSGNAVTFAIDSTVATLTGSQTLTNKTLTSPVLNTGVSGTAVLDEDNMASNSATQLATQQSIKAYVDSQVGANNELSEILANGNTTGGTNIVFGDSASVSDDRLVFGAGSDLQIYHSGTHSYIDDAGTGNLTLRGNASVRVEKYEGEILADFAADGAVSLYHDNSVKIATTSSGVSVTGNVAVSGTVDGRDVATDGTKLDGIEASADVTDTANVTAAGALMDSELTSIASVKALNQGVATTDSPTFAAVTVNGNVEFDGLSGTGSVTVTDILDQDDMSGNSATALATQQSIKAYVDSQVATADTLSEVLANGNTTGGTDVAFGDNDKAIFGAGSDLEILSQGTDALIRNGNATAEMRIESDDRIVISDRGFNEAFAVFNDDSDVKLYHDGSQKLATTSTGIDVTGTVTTDGISSSGDITITESTPSISFVDSDGTNQIGKLRQVADTVILSARNNTAYGNFKFTGEDGSTEKTRLQINGVTGDISFYEDTGTTAKLFWDASAESLGIGTSSPAAPLDVAYADNANIFRASYASSEDNFFLELDSAILTGGVVGYQFHLKNNGTSYNNMLTFDRGNVGIGTSSPSTTLDVLSSSNQVISNFAHPSASTASVNGGAMVRIQNTNATNGNQSSLIFADSSAGASSGIFGFNTNHSTHEGYMVFGTRNSGGSFAERMRINSSGNVNIGSTNSGVSGSLDVSIGSTSSTGGVTLWSPTNGTHSLGFGDGYTGTDRYRGYVEYAHGDDSMRLATASTERMRIDASGNVGIGVTDPAGLLEVFDVLTVPARNTVSVANQRGLSVYQNQSNGLLDTTLVYGNATSSYLAFGHHNGTSYAERMRLDASGNLLVGTTNTLPAINNVEGIALSTGSFGGRLEVSRDGAEAVSINRKTDDGSLMSFKKDGTTIGSIGVQGDRIYLAGANEAVGIDDSWNAFVPLATGGGNSDADTDLGNPSSRFKDLYLSGSITLAAGSQINSSTAFYLDSDIIHFRLNNEQESARIDSSRNFLVGKTDTTFSTSGIELRAGNNGARFIRSNAEPVLMNRTGSDGKVLGIYKDGTEVGSIGTDNGIPYFLRTSGGIAIGNTALLSADSSGAINDATSDLGGASNRWKDLYLSGQTIVDGGAVSAPSYSFAGDTNTGISRPTSDAVNIVTGGSERLRVDNSGNLLVGKSSTSGTTVGHAIKSNGQLESVVDGSYVSYFNRKTSAGTIALFALDGAQVGSISVTSSATAYNTSSDQRLKDNIVDAPSASDDIDAIQVRSFDWKADGSHQKYGMVAQELQGVAPEAVTGDADSDDMMGVDYSKLVPMMLKEIQSLRARVAQLEGEN
jgi:hypothetical protein